MAQVSIYNHHKFARAILKKSRKSEPSLTIELYSDHWKFKNSETILAYDGPMRPFLVALRAQIIPSFLVPIILEQDPPVSIADGCLIVEIHDYRPPSPLQIDEGDKRRLGTNVFSKNPFKNSRSSMNGAGLGTSATIASIAGVGSGTVTPPGQPGPASGLGQTSGTTETSGEPSFIRNRVIMKPDSESLYETLLSMHQTWNRMAAKENQPPLDWDDASILELEARILAAIAPPLCLDTSFLTARVANLASILTAPNLPHVAADGSYIPKSKRREWMYGAVPNKDDDSDVEEDTTTANVNASQEAEEHAKKMSAMSTTAISEKLGISKKDWAMLVLGPKKPPATSLQDAGRKPFDEEIFYRRQIRTRMEQNQTRSNGAAAANDPPPPPERDVNMRDTGGPSRNADEHQPRGSIDHGDPGPPKRPRPKKKKKTMEPDAPEPIDVDMANTAGPSGSQSGPSGSQAGDADASAKAKPRPKPKPSAGKAKKRTAEEMTQDGEGTVVGSPMTIDGSIAPTPTTATRPKPKKPTKKQQEALAKQQAADEAAAAAAAVQAEPPKKKTKKASAAANSNQGGQTAPAPGLPSGQNTGNGGSFLETGPSNVPNFNGPPLGINLGGGPVGISEDDFLAAAEAFGAGGLDSVAGMPAINSAPPINMPLQFQPSQGFAMTEQMQEQLALAQNGGAGIGPGPNLSRQPGGGLSRAPPPA